jgi:hypothetical protein
MTQFLIAQRLVRDNIAESSRKPPVPVRLARASMALTNEDFSKKDWPGPVCPHQRGIMALKKAQ